MKSQFQLWVEGCEENKTILYPLEQSDVPETGLWKMQNQYEYKHNYMFTTPVYRAWVSGVTVYCGQSYNDAYNAFRKGIEDNGRLYGLQE